MVRVVAAAVVAAAVLLTVWAVYRTLGRPMPRAAWPMLIAASLIGYGVYDEYSWRSRMLAGLPDSVKVLGTGASRTPLAPWSYLVPRTDRLSVANLDAIRTNPKQPGLRLIELVLLERMRPTLRVREALDCANARTAVLSDDTAFADDGSPVGADWYPLEPDDPRLQELCG